jgi:hypothetical protein
MGARRKSRPRRGRRVDRTQAERQARRRARAERGRNVYDVVAQEDAVVRALHASGRVPVDKIPTRARIERELAEIVAFWAKRWNQNGHA